MRLISLLPFLFLTRALIAQEPSFFIFAKEEFEGVDIYDVIQDDDLNYWFATELGLFVHDGYAFDNIISEEMKASSVFNFQKDRSGTIYCHNLSHQVFRIQNKKIELFYELPTDARQYNMSIAVDEQDHLLVQSKTVVRISPDKEVELLIEETQGILPLLKMDELVYCIQGMDLNREIYKIKGNQVEKVKLKANCTIPESEAYYWDKNESANFLISRKDLKLYYLENDLLQCAGNLDIDLKGQVMRPERTKNITWVIGQNRGAYVFDPQFKPRFKGNRIFEDYLISDVYEDHEGNTLLSTFDQGVLVVPKTDLVRQNVIEDQIITKIVGGNDGELLLGSTRGEIILYQNGEPRILDKEGLPKVIEILKYWPQRDALLYDVQGGFNILDDLHGDAQVHEEKIGSLKSFQPINENSAVIGLNSGLRILGYSEGRFFIKNDFAFYDRVYSVAYDEKNDLVYAGTTEGLKAIQRNGQSENLKLNDEAIFANDIFRNGDDFFIGTRRNGVLVLKNGKFRDQIDIDGQVIKVMVLGKFCLVMSRTGLYQYDLETSVLKRINQAFGLQHKKIIDFHATKDVIYVSTSNGLQFQNVSKLNESFEPPPVNRLTVSVDGKESDATIFQYNQAQLQFNFFVSTLRYRDDISYLYRLEGLDTVWHSLPYEQNGIKYNALAPGQYRFVVKSKNQNRESDAKHFDFKIAAPFYLKWWFYLLVTLSSITMVVFFFRRRLHLQEQRSAQERELNASRLTAIQSQMNPHFIFNSLNSIQDLVMRGDSEKSYSFITKFANLVRRTLNVSDKDLIDFDEEIKLLELYLSLEKLRFKEDFEYDIHTGDIEGIRLPPMLIQPFIENALVHGLLHREGLRRLDISFQLNEHLICTIRDNGIGREKAKEIQNRQRGKHESFATKAINRRMSILQKRFGENIGFKYEDLYEGNEAKGTVVTLSLPVERQF